LIESATTPPRSGNAYRERYPECWTDGWRDIYIDQETQRECRAIVVTACQDALPPSSLSIRDRRMYDQATSESRRRRIIAQARIDMLIFGLSGMVAR
jgi:hypothetical protein